ncbi:Uncharacterized protein APZ42_009246 [Daphnia magna]|uniref:Uncharacterized protein n=1 Tax=Daphnia magna TaxID=35525 RepID=A0A164E4K1_9CRUS|nr:Uncharacterized protein APZ42_009246 [Daphnia magna]
MPFKITLSFFPHQDAAKVLIFLIKRFQTVLYHSAIIFNGFFRFLNLGFIGEVDCLQFPPLVFRFFFSNVVAL